MQRAHQETRIVSLSLPLTCSVTLACLHPLPGPLTPHVCKTKVAKCGQRLDWLHMNHQGESKMSTNKEVVKSTTISNIMEFSTAVKQNEADICVLLWKDV